MDFLKTVISQYGNSPSLLAMIKTMNDCIDPSIDIAMFYEKVIDIDTAVGFGLDYWGEIVGVSRILNVQPVSNYLGFNEGQTIVEDYQNFDHGIFYSGPIDGALVLADSAYKVLILVKALSNISDGTAYSYNRLLSLLFNQKVYTEEIGPMQARYVFSAPLQPYEIAILATNSVVPRPAGVKITFS